MTDAEKNEIISKLKYKGEPDPNILPVGSPEYIEAMKDWVIIQRLCYPKRQPYGLTRSDSFLDDLWKKKE